MRKVERLKKEARECAEWRGHKLGRFVRHSWRKGHWFADCQNEHCTAGVYIELDPLPNSIDISGAAVAVDCPNCNDQDEE